MKLACVAIVKNEQNHVAEWIAYQLAIGFDTVIVFDNQSTDDTAARIRAFAPHHDVRLHEWTMTTPDYQTRCYEHAARSYTDEFDWLAFFDIDEFLVLDPGFDLKSILNLFPATPAIGVPWAMFGSSGHTEKPDGLLIEAFTHRSEPSFGPNRHIKSIIRPKHMLYCHNAHSFAMDGQYRSLTGKPLTFTQGGLLDTDPDYTLGKLHHYFTRSRAHWADKMQRGYHDTSREDSEFEAYDRNEIPDDSARDLAPRVREILANLGTATAQTAPTFISPPAQSPNPQETPSFLKERSKELSPESIRRPGEWALLTEFGTLLCWDSVAQVMCHRPPGDLAGYSIVLWRCNNRDELVAEMSGHLALLDHQTGHRASPLMQAQLVVEPGERTQDVAFNIGNGFYLSAREGTLRHGPGIVDHHVRKRNAWECFTPIARQTALDLISLQTNRWIIRNHPSSLAEHPAEPVDRDHFRIADRLYPISQNLPQTGAITSQSGLPTSAILRRDTWQIDEVIRFKPLIVFSLFDNPDGESQLRIAIDSLLRFGEYCSDILVITDRQEYLVRMMIPEELRPNLLVHRLLGTTAADRDNVALILPDIPEIADHQPTIITTSNVIFDAALQPVLASLIQNARLIGPASPYSLAKPAANDAPDLRVSDSTLTEMAPSGSGEIWGIPSLRIHRTTLLAFSQTFRAYLAEESKDATSNPAWQFAEHIATRLDCFDQAFYGSTVRHIAVSSATQEIPDGNGISYFSNARTANTDTTQAMRAYHQSVASRRDIDNSEVDVVFMSEREVLAQFQSLGDNCEFGNVQRQFGLEHLGFLKWFRSTARSVAEGLDDSFKRVGGPGDFAVETYVGEYHIRHLHYDIGGHSQVMANAVDKETFTKSLVKRIPYLRDKLLEDIDDANYIFVYNCYKEHPQATNDDFRALAEAIARRGSAYLLCVSPAAFTRKPVDTVEWIGNNILLAHKDEFTSFGDRPEDYLPGWLRIARKALALVRKRHHVDHLRDRDIVAQFQSIGDNCEFGLVQRVKGYEAIGLLRWCNVSIESLTAALQHRFEGFAEGDQLTLGDHGGEITFIDHVFGFSGHSFVHRGDFDEAKFLNDQRKRLRYLRDKFIDDLKDDQTVLVYKRNDPPEEKSMLTIAGALAEIGPANLLWVVESPDHPEKAAQVEWLAPNLLRAYIDYLAPYHSAPLSSHECWMKICRSTLKMIYAREYQGRVAERLF